MSSKIVIFVFLTLLIGIVSAPASSATGWGQLTRSWDGQERVSGSGTFYNHRNTHAKTKWQFSDEARDGNTVYARTSVAMYRSCTSGGNAFCWAETHTSGEISNATTTRYGTTKLHHAGSRARGAVKVCVQLGFPRRDRCSTTAYPTFDY